jgi:hypothetical protein
LEFYFRPFANKKLPTLALPQHETLDRLRCQLRAAPLPGSGVLIKPRRHRGPSGSGKSSLEFAACPGGTQAKPDFLPWLS